MKAKITRRFFLLFSIIIFCSCESEAEKKQRLAEQEQQRIELQSQLKQEADQLVLQQEKERIEQEAQLEKEHEEKVIYDKYIDNSLQSGSTPYSYCFGGNKPCSDYECSKIRVTTPSNSDVIVTIKKNEKVYRHAYISRGSSYTFEFPNGTYQAFFYYGKGWNPDKNMKATDCGVLKGGFIADEQFGKDSPQTLENNILEYELILQQNGNFSTSPSNSEEAF